MLEPGVRKDAVQPTEDVDQALDANILAMKIADHDEAAGEDLLVRDHVGGPVEGMAAVVNGTAALRLLVHSAEKLPFRRAHLGTCAGAAWRRVEEEANNERVALRDEEAAKLVQPEGAVDTRRRLGELKGRGAS